MYMRLNPKDKEDMAKWLREASHKGHLGDAIILNVEDGLIIPGKDTPAADLNHVNIQRRLEHYFMLTRLFQKIEQARTEGVTDAYIAFTEAVGADVVPGEKASIHCADGRTIEGTHLVLSNGHGPVKPPAFLAAAHEQAPHRVVIDQWATDHQTEQLLSDPTIKTVVVLGTGLSAMDVVMTAERVKFFDDPTRMLIFNSRGKHTHPIMKEGQTYMEPKVDINDLISRLPQTVAGVPDFVQTVFTELQNQGENTIGRAHTDEETFAALKVTIPTLLKASGFEPRDLVPFLHKYSSVLTTKAVPMAAIIGETFEHYRDLGRVPKILGASPEVIEYNAAGHPDHPNDCMAIKVTKDGGFELLYCAAIISALPPQSDPESVPLLKDLLDKGILSREKQLGSGVAVNGSYQAIGADGEAITNVYIVGPVVGGQEMLDHGQIGPYFQIASTLSVEAEVISRKLVANSHKKLQTLFPILV